MAPTMAHKRAKAAAAATHILDDDADASEPALFWFGEA